MSGSARPPRQARSREMLERVLSTAEQLFAERGETGFTIPEVSRRAGVSIGTVYRRFDTKEDLLLAVLRRVQEQEEAGVLVVWQTVAWATMGGREMIDRLARDLARNWRERAPLMRAMMARRLLVSGDGVSRQGSDVGIHQAALFRHVVLSHVDEIVHPDPDRAIDFAYRLIIAMCARWTANAFETQAPEPMSWDDMLDRLGDTISADLFGRPTPDTRP